MVNRQTPFLRDSQVRAAQERILASPQTFAGPDYDTLAPEDRPDGIHLSLAGQSKAARLWADALDERFYRDAKPWVPCAASAGQVVVEATQIVRCDPRP